MTESMDGGEFPVGVIRPAVPPPGAVFSLGWVLAELFDRRRRVGVRARRPPFNPAVQLPGVPDLGAENRLEFLAAELAELAGWYPDLAGQAARVAAEAGRAKSAAAEPPFSEAALVGAVSELHQAVLGEFADDPERLGGYQLGLALSDLVWLPYIAAPGADPDPAAGKPSALLAMFSRPQLATVKTLLNGAGGQLPPGAAAVVSRSLDNWADWLDVNTASFAVPGADAWSERAAPVLDALRVQGQVWRSVLIADPEVGTEPGMGAWAHAGASIARAAGMISAAVLRRFWPLVVVAIAALVGLLSLVIANLSGAGQVWASLVTVAAVLGSGGFGLGSSVSRSFGGVGYEIWAAARLDAAAWSVTWLPALTSTPVDRVRLDMRGVAAPRLRKNLDVS